MRALHVLGAATLIAAVAPAAQFVDDFNDNVTDPALWSTFSTGPGVAEQNGRIEVAIPSTSAGDIFGAGYDFVPRFIGDFDVSVEFDHPVWPAGNGVRTGLAATTSAGFLNVERTCLSTAGGEYMLTDINHALTLVDYPATSGKMRITRVGDLLTGYYWDGAWQTLATWAGGSDKAKIQIWSWSHDAFFGHQNSLATFDSFWAQGSVPELPAGPILLLAIAVMEKLRAGSRR